MELRDGMSRVGAIDVRIRGHAPSTTMTVDTDGRWLPKGDKAAIDSLDDAVTTRDGDFGGDLRPAAANSDAGVGIVPQELRELATNGP
jgi:hypothetical protein